jgi:hypothetical protein
MRDGAKWLGLLRILDGTIYGPVNNQKEVVASTHIGSSGIGGGGSSAGGGLATGRMVICSASSQSSETVAAAFLMFGDHKWP